MTFFPCTLPLVRCFQFQGIIWKTEHGGENPDFDFAPLLPTLLTYKPFILRPVSVVSASFYRLLQMVLPCFRWLQLVLDGYRSFQVVLDRSSDGFSSFLLVSTKNSTIRAKKSIELRRLECVCLNMFYSCSFSWFFLLELKESYNFATIKSRNY